MADGAWYLRTWRARLASLLRCINRACAGAALRLEGGDGEEKVHPAVKFLWVIAGLTVLFIAGAVAYRLFEKELMRWAMVPSVEFSAVPMPGGRRLCARRGMWIARPDIAGNPSLWAPPGFAPTARARAPRSSSSTRPASSNRRPGTRRSTTGIAGPGGAVRAQPGERVQRRRRESGRPNTARRRSAPSCTSEDNARAALDFAYRDVRRRLRAVPARRRRRTGRSSSPRTARAAST